MDDQPRRAGGVARPADPGVARRSRPDSRRRRHPEPVGRKARRLWAGGTEGNERLTVFAGLLLIVLFAALGVTIVAIGRLLWLHLFLGLLLLGPVALKLATTGYRFVRYYAAEPSYREKGPPLPLLRGLAPIVVLLTVAVFGTGVALLILGPGSRQPLGELHKLSFIAWIVVTAVHVLGHVPETLDVLSDAAQTRRDILASRGGASDRPRSHEPAATSPVPGGRGRAAALLVALLSGTALAIALVGQYSVWTH